MSLKILFETGASTEKGMKYVNNQDNYLVDPDAAIFMVADGVGGGPAGDVASRVAVNAASQSLRSSPQPDDEEYLKHQLEKAIQKAHAALKSVAQQAPAYQGMGTTLTLLWGPGSRERFFLGHIGDCRGYFIRQGHCSLLTRDQTVLNVLLEANQLPEDPAQWPPRNLLSQVLGSSEKVIPMIVSQTISPGDLFFLCSDGVYDSLTDESILQVLTQPYHPQLICETAIRAAMENGATDNLTAVGVRISSLVAEHDLLTASLAVTVQGEN